MAYIDRYIGSLHSSNLMDDSRHSATESLAASALADVSVDGIGALLDIVIKKLSLKNDAALSRLLRVAPPVISKTRSRALVVGPNLAIRIMDATDITTQDLYRWMGVR